MWKWIRRNLSSIITGLSLSLLLVGGIFLAIEKEYIADRLVNLAYWGLIISVVTKVIELRVNRDYKNAKKGC